MSRGSQKGFSLLELMVVVAILGILAAIATPRLLTYLIEARVADGKAMLHNTRMVLVARQAGVADRSLTADEVAEAITGRVGETWAAWVPGNETFAHSYSAGVGAGSWEFQLVAKDSSRFRSSKGATRLCTNHLGQVGWVGLDAVGVKDGGDMSCGAIGTQLAGGEAVK